MFIKLTKSGNGKYSYVHLVEGYRDADGKVHHRRVQTFGRLDELEAQDPDYLAKLKAQFQQDRSTKQQVTSAVRAEAAKAVVEAGQKEEKLEEDFPLLRYGHYVLKQIWEKDLGLHRKFKYIQATSNEKAEFNFNQVASFMVFKKAMKPASVLSSFQDQDEYLGAPLQGVPLAACYKTLDVLKENKDDIFKLINKQLDKMYGKERATLVFYDVTNAYFESPLTDAEMENYNQDFLDKLQAVADEDRKNGSLPQECFDDEGVVMPECLSAEYLESVADNHNPVFLRMRGPSKEHRSDLPIVSIAMVIDKHGFPMDFEVFKGNSSEYITMEDAIKKLQAKYAIGHAVVVADRGLNSVANLRMLKNLELGYLVAQKVTTLPEEIKAKMLQLNDYNPIDPNDPSEGKYLVIDNWEKSGTGDKIKCSLLLTWSEKRRRRDEKLLDIWVDLVRRRDGKELKTRKPAWAAIAKTDTKEKKQFVTGIDEQALAKRRALCGFAAMVYDEHGITRDEPEETDEPQIEETPNAAKKQATVTVKEPDDKAGLILKSGREAASQYHRLNQIENCFRIMKSNTGLRPMHVWKSDHIYGHVTACVMALLLLRLLQDKMQKQGTPISIDVLCRELHDSTVMAQLIDDDQCTFYRCGFGPKLRKGFEQLTEEELGAKYVTGKARWHKAEILKACGLKLPPRVCSRAELAASLGTRFPTNRSAIPMLRELGQK